MSTRAHYSDAEYDSIRATILRWSIERRTALVHDLIDTIAQSEGAPAQRVRTLSTALGLLSTDGSAPTDAEVQTWLDDYKTEKYG
ncbi:MAG: hypothetical protein M3441_22385 [Chloroflexota bacterium]|nr:hypothetical protein [Chloroflexota bacterium]